MDPEVKKRIVTAALRQMDREELFRVRLLVREMLQRKNSYPAYDQLESLIRERDLSAAFKTVALVACGHSRDIASSSQPVQQVVPLRELIWLKEKIDSLLLMAVDVAPSAVSASRPPSEKHAVKAGNDLETFGIIKVYEAFVGRTPKQAEIDLWKGRLREGLGFPKFLRRVSESDDAVAYRQSREILPGEWDGQFIQAAYELLQDRGCKAGELLHWEGKLAEGMGRHDVLTLIFSDAARSLRNNGANPPPAEPPSHPVKENRFVTIPRRQNKGIELSSSDRSEPDYRYRHRFGIKSGRRYLVTAITTLRAAAASLEQFIDNIVSQSCFKDYCELIVVDGGLPQDEYDVIKRRLAAHDGIRCIRSDYRGICDAWNAAVREARGDYLSNVSPDDLRRQDSLELQAGVLDNLPFVDVTYQDFYLALETGLSFEEVAARGYAGELPIVTRYNMMDFNFPGNASMWRKRLHDEVGHFDTGFTSAGDYEFWMRCLVAGKIFYKLNDPHVAHRQNADERSSDPGETKRILRLYGQKLVSANLLMPLDQFCIERLALRPPLDLQSRNRYAAAQRSLRNAAQRLKYPVSEQVDE